MWGTDLLLTAASMICKFSQGKANLFVVVLTNEHSLMVDIRSKAFVGAFPLNQLLDTDSTYRNMPVPSSLERFSNPAAYAVAAQALFMNDITIGSIETAQFASTVEKDLGTTHILAIPLRSSRAQCRVGDEAVIAVDLRFIRPWLLWARHRGPSKGEERIIKERARKVQEMARQLYVTRQHE